MRIRSTDVRTSAFLILTLHAWCTLSQIRHELTYFVGCFEHSKTEVQYAVDTDEILHVDFSAHTVVFSVPSDMFFDVSTLFESTHVYRNAKKGEKTCSIAMPLVAVEEKHPSEKKDPPQVVVYPAEEIKPDVENDLICYVNHFYPPNITVNWTKNGQPLSAGVSLSRYHPDDDGTFFQFSTMTFTPEERSVYRCTVDHPALETPITRIWEAKFDQPSIMPDIFCGVGLILGLCGISVGVFLIVKRCHRREISSL